MPYLHEEWTSNYLSETKVLRVRISVDELPQALLDPLVEYQILDTLNVVTLGEGRFHLSSLGPERLLEYLRDCRDCGQLVSKRAVLPLQQVACEMVLGWAREKFG
ncbi:hypothetical protein [Cellvibrio polysaccharolyticus]|uniref:WYL domain-containing protein n=1 Tax=Cellvibrio polysaccharolyticus TaxID=2082724 RepID=A0A928V2G4_9GAMM|nr:hypothetical protein [Cellvibrio polysaccharolyticus]MBE8717571.1 hypothetical protein [Cellvibrio polysaccharolyticus]